MLYFRRSPPPKIVRQSLAVSTEHQPGLAKWLWSHPWIAPEVMRRVLAKAEEDGTLDSILREIENGEGPSQ